jgi:hypothetical protein
MTRFRGCAAVALVSICVSPAGAAAAGLPVGHAKGVSVRVGRAGVDFRFAKTLDPTLAAVLRPGRRVELSCTTLDPPRIDGTRTSNGISARVRLPGRLTRLRLPTGTRQHPSFCTIRLVATEIDFVDVPVTEDGAVYVDERHTVYEIRNAAFTAAQDAEDAHGETFESAEEFVRKYGAGGDLVALASADATPPPRTTGIFSDGNRHFEAVALTTLGRRMFYDIDGDVLTTNGTTYLTDPDGA